MNKYDVMDENYETRNGARGCFVGAMLSAAFALSCAISTAAAQNPPPPPPYLANFPNFATALTSPFPGDADMALKESLENQKPPQFAAVQRLFDLDAWQMFLAVNWPTNDQGQPAPSITDLNFGAPHWTLWQTSSQIYRVDGKRPMACGPAPGGKILLESVARQPAPLLRGLPLIQKPTNVNPRSVLVLGNLSAVGNVSVLNLKTGEIKQAFSGPLIDQNGNFVHYEIAMDPHEVEYICSNGIYNVNGQIDFGKAHSALNFPSGTDTVDWSGSTEVKFAWKIIDTSKGDQPGRFFTMPATIPTADGGTQQVTVGLVGMHIGHKSQTSPQWIWATFEQVDNLVGNPMAHPPINASFYNPDCEICVPNVEPATTGDYTTPTQAVRAIQIPGDKIELNAEAQAALKGADSVWQYYQLIDTQWPTDPSAKPTPWDGGLPGAINNKPGGDPTPVFLTNITMETYFQQGLQDACHQEELPDTVKIPCPPTAPANFPNVAAKVFASESCMGCHSSAGFYKLDTKTKAIVTLPQHTGDFSWLPEQKACYIGAPPAGSPTDLQICQ